MSLTPVSLFMDSPFGSKITPDNILETLDFFDDWEDRYRYVIDLGKELVALPQESRTEESLVHGCQSQVWVSHYRDAVTSKDYFLFDSDAHIVRGLAAIVLAAMNGRSCEEIAAFDVDAYFEKLDLIAHLSPSRGNGLRAMVQRVKALAASA